MKTLSKPSISVNEVFTMKNFKEFHSPNLWALKPRYTHQCSSSVVVGRTLAIDAPHADVGDPTYRLLGYDLHVDCLGLSLWPSCRVHRSGSFGTTPAIQTNSTQSSTGQWGDKDDDKDECGQRAHKLHHVAREAHVISQRFNVLLLRQFLNLSDGCFLLLDILLELVLCQINVIF